jgi:hypothetical protein
MRDVAPQGTYKVQALDRAFAVLDLLGESETPLGLAPVASWFSNAIAWSSAR